MLNLENLIAFIAFSYEHFQEYAPMYKKRGDQHTPILLNFLFAFNIIDAFAIGNDSLSLCQVGYPFDKCL